MKWLKYEEKQNNFCFVHSKCDGMDEGQKLRSLNAVCGELEIDISVTNESLRPQSNSNLPQLNSTSTVQMVNTLGFPPKAPYKDIQEDLKLLQDCIINCQVYPESERGKHNPQLQRIKISAPDNNSLFSSLLHNCTIL